ncbi:MAG: hypothetical protein A2252_03195 [Elusimicrobia bacterium RIFOXYA2_FULL_39_19]|nr:MAG: hypothetical protein A2252_03195 [Elusimicrobia bacterium RIFOXYA2_FULL_39_19]
MNPDIEFSLVIPFYNEEKNAEFVCNDILHTFRNKQLTFELIAVNNGSQDNTPEILARQSQNNKEIKVVKVDVNQGYGHGVLQGLKTAKGVFIGYSVGDRQISADDVYEVFNEARMNDLEYCQGKRTNRKDTLLRTLNTRFFHFIFHILFPSPITDNGSNPKIFKKTWYERIQPESKDWFLDSEIIIKTSVLKGKMKEVPVTFLKRKEGKSKINILASFEMLKNLFKWRLRKIR